ncbi:hypothetical protein ACWDTD_20045 [Gordonia sp. NPDC003425]
MASTDIYSGDLWVLSWDLRDIGLAFVAAVQQDYVLAWPVTLPGEASFTPGLVVDDSPLGESVTLWPTRETGIAMHLLDRKLGRLLPSERIRQIAFALDDDEDPGLAFASGSAWDPENADADRDLIDHWTALCFHTADAADETLLDSARVTAAGGSARRVGEALGMSSGQLRPVWEGVEPISDEHLFRVAQQLNVDRHELTRPDPLAVVMKRLALPKFKRAVTDRMGATGLSEMNVRTAARREFTLAARDDGITDEVIDRKLFDAVNRVGR